MQLARVHNMNKYEKDVIRTVFQAKKNIVLNKYIRHVLFLLALNEISVHCKINKQVTWYTVLYYVN